MYTMKQLIKLMNSDLENKKIHFNNWLDDIQLREEYKNNKDFLQEEPIWENIPIERQAFYAGVAHYLSNKCGLEKPSWVLKEEYFLDKPYFSLNAKGKLQLVLLAESPNEFRIRNIFISANSLDRV